MTRINKPFITLNSCRSKSSTVPVVFWHGRIGCFYRNGYLLGTSTFLSERKYFHIFFVCREKPSCGTSSARSWRPESLGIKPETGSLKRPPVFLKITPDLTEQDMADIANVIMNYKEVNKDIIEIASGSLHVMHAPNLSQQENSGKQ